MSSVLEGPCNRDLQKASTSKVCLFIIPSQWKGKWKFRHHGVGITPFLQGTVNVPASYSISQVLLCLLEELTLL